MKVFELIRDKVYAEKIQNPESVGSFSLNNTEHQYKVKDVIFDNESGLGRVPNNSNVNYLGFTALMRIDDFLDLAAAHNGQRDESAQDIKELIDQGYGIATPWLQLDIQKVDEKTGKARVIGHEGRARAIACQKYFGLKEIPIHIFPASYRARHITTEFIDAMNRDGIESESSSEVIRQSFRKVFKA